MKPVAASPVLHHARALGRAFRGAGRALRQGRTWFLIGWLSLGLPWLVLLGQMFIYGGPRPPDPSFGGTIDSAINIAVNVAMHVSLLALLVPVLEGPPDISLRRLGPSVRWLILPVAALTGAYMVWDRVLLSGWDDPVQRALGSRESTIDLAMCLVQAWVAAWVVSAMRDGAWPWAARHLLVGGALFAAGLIGAGRLSGWVYDQPRVFDELVRNTWIQVPPDWWIVHRLGESLFALVALEYLRIEPPHAPAEAAP